MLPRYKDIVDLLKKGSTLEAQEQIMSLREGALELQEENQELKQRIRELEQIIRSSENWATEESRYSLVNQWEGPAQTYALKESAAQGDKPHYLCTNCFHQEQKVILTPQSKDGWIYMVCPSCKASLRTGYKGIGEARYTEEYDSNNG